MKDKKILKKIPMLALMVVIFVTLVLVLIVAGAALNRRGDTGAPDPDVIEADVQPVQD